MDVRWDIDGGRGFIGWLGLVNAEFEGGGGGGGKEGREMTIASSGNSIQVLPAAPSGPDSTISLSGYVA